MKRQGLLPSSSSGEDACVSTKRPNCPNGAMPSHLSGAGSEAQDF